MRCAARARRALARAPAGGRSGPSTAARESSGRSRSARSPHRGPVGGLSPRRAPHPGSRPREGTARPPTLRRGGLRRLSGPTPPVSWSAAEWLLAYAQHVAVLLVQREDARRSADSPVRAAPRKNTRLLGETAENRERALRSRFPDDLAARLDLAVEALRQLVRVLAGRGADDEIAEAPLRLVALGFELLRELVGLLAGRALDPPLPRGKAAVELFLLPGLHRRLVVPAVLRVDPVLDPARLRLDAVRAQLRLDNRERALGRGARRGVDEDRLVVARDREAVG